MKRVSNVTDYAERNKLVERIESALGNQTFALAGAYGFDLDVFTDDRGIPQINLIESNPEGPELSVKFASKLKADRWEFVAAVDLSDVLSDPYDASFIENKLRRYANVSKIITKINSLAVNTAE